MKNSILKQLLSVVGIAVMVIAFTDCGQRKSAALENEQDSISYALGYDVGRFVKKDKYELNSDAFVKGFEDIYLDKDSVMSEDDVNNLLTKYREFLMEQKSASVKKAGEEFLAENKKEEGVVVLENGMQYKVLKTGSGKTPADTSEVSVHYTGKFIDGRVFESSLNRGEPAKFRVDRVIPGWRYILPKMKIGDKWAVYIPSDLAYGNYGTPDGSIQPGTTLIFEIELLKIH